MNGQRNECACGHDRDSHYVSTEKTDTKGTPLRQYHACLATFCPCEEYKQRGKGS